MRLRKQPWIETAILEHLDLVTLTDIPSRYGHWQDFFPAVQPLHLEIGTGRGNFLVGMAHKYPQYNFIGVEANIDIIYDVIMKVKKSSVPISNIRLIRGDAAQINTWFAPGEISQIYLNFSDPWPKNRHAKRRLTHINFLKMYGQISLPGTTVKQKTDNDDFFAFTLQTVLEHKLKLLSVTNDLYASAFDNPVATEYEKRFVRLGKNINFCEFHVH